MLRISSQPSPRLKTAVEIGAHFQRRQSVDALSFRQDPVGFVQQNFFHAVKQATIGSENVGSALAGRSFLGILAQKWMAFVELSASVVPAVKHQDPSRLELSNLYLKAQDLLDLEKHGENFSLQPSSWRCPNYCHQSCSFRLGVDSYRYSGHAAVPKVHLGYPTLTLFGIPHFFAVLLSLLFVVYHYASTWTHFLGYISSKNFDGGILQLRWNQMCVHKCVCAFFLAELIVAVCIVLKIFTHFIHPPSIFTVRVLIYNTPGEFILYGERKNPWGRDSVSLWGVFVGRWS